MSLWEKVDGSNLLDNIGHDVLDLRLKKWCLNVVYFSLKSNSVKPLAYSTGKGGEAPVSGRRERAGHSWPNVAKRCYSSHFAPHPASPCFTVFASFLKFVWHLACIIEATSSLLLFPSFFILCSNYHLAALEVQHKIKLPPHSNCT